MAAIDKLYDSKDNVVLRLDRYTREELHSFIEQIKMNIEEMDEDES